MFIDIHAHAANKNSFIFGNVKKKCFLSCNFYKKKALNDFV